MKRFILISTLFAISLSLFSQKTSKGKLLTRDILNQATTIVFTEDNGSVPPEYEYQYNIEVSKDAVRFVLYREYMERKPYDKKMRISNSHYQQFINKLSGQGIRVRITSEMPEVGGGHSRIIVKKQGNVLFEGDEESGLTVSKGRLKDAFMLLLNANMKRELKGIK